MANRKSQIAEAPAAGPGLVRVEITVETYVSGAKGHVRVTPGEQLGLPTDEAAHLIRIGKAKAA